jgi:hypothetical protein
MKAIVHVEKEISGRESQGACRQDQRIGGKPTVVMYFRLGLEKKLSLCWRGPAKN